MSEKKRVTMHNGRTHKGGKTFSSKHNDHTEKGEWDVEKRKDCVFWKSKKCPGATFDEGEQAFYEAHFRKTLDAQNKRHRENRHEDRVKNMDQFRHSKSYCPEGTLVYLGDKDNHASIEDLKGVMVDFLKWHQKTYPQCFILNWDLHADEAGAPHCDMRRVWMAHDKEGNWTVSQNKCLEEMGVERPNKEAPSGKHNNAKMTYTEACRKKLIELAKARGIEIEEEPRPKEESGKSLGEFLEDKAAKKEQEAIKLVEEMKEANKTDAETFEEKKAIIDDLRGDLIKSTNNAFKDDLGGKLRATSVIRECIQRALAKLGIIKARVDARTEQIKKVEPTYTLDLEMPQEEMERE